MKSRTALKLSALSSLSGILLLANQASASSAQIIDLPPQLVTATRTLEDPFTLPYSADIISPNAFSANSKRTLMDTLQTAPSVLLQRTGYGQVSPFIRGFTGFRTLMLIDGIRLNNSVFRSGPNQYFGTVDSHSVERLELLRGPASVLYGSDAVGGTLNAITYTPALLSAESDKSIELGGRISSRISSAEESFGGRAEGEFRTSRMAFSAGASHRDFDDVEGGKDVGTQPGTAYTESAADAKGVFKVTDKLNAVIAYQYFEQNNAPRTHATVDGILWEGLSRSSDIQRDFDQERQLAYLQLIGTDLDGIADSAQLSLSWQRQAEVEDRIRSNGRRSFQGFEADTIGLFSTLTSETSIGSLTYGAEYYHDSVDSSGITYDDKGAVRSIALQGPVADDSSYDLFGVFVQDRLPLSETFSLMTGARWDYARTKAGVVVAPSAADPSVDTVSSIKDSWNQLTGNLRLSWQPGGQARHHFYMGLGSSFRAPNLSDLSRLDVARSDLLEVASPNLDPEKFVTFETGWKYSADSLSFEVAYYYTHTEDEIVITPTGRIIDRQGSILKEVAKTNAGNGHVQGAELSVRWSITKEFLLSTSLTLQDGKVETYSSTSNPVLTDEPVSRLIPITVNSSIRWNPENLPIWSELSITVAEKQDRLSSGDRGDNQRIPPGGTPGYETFNFYLGWYFTGNSQLTLAVENIFDEDYRVHGSGINSPGRNFIASVDWRF